MKTNMGYVSFVMTTALLAAACGGADSVDGGGRGLSEITAAADEFSFSPDVWTASAGSEVTFQFDNQGSVIHYWVILSSPIESESEFSEDLIVFETSAEAGEAVTNTFTAPAAGTYQVICKVPGHFSDGMEGLLTVTGA